MSSQSFQSQNQEDQIISDGRAREASEEKKENSGAQQEIKVMTDAIEQIIANGSSPALDNFYYIYAMVQEVQGNLKIVISQQKDASTERQFIQTKWVTFAECQVVLPNLNLRMRGNGDSPMEALVDLTEKLRPIVDKFVEDKKSVNPCSVM